MRRGAAGARSAKIASTGGGLVRKKGSEVVLAASDLGSFLECRHKAELDHEVNRPGKSGGSNR